MVAEGAIDGKDELVGAQAVGNDIHMRSWRLINS